MKWTPKQDEEIAALYATNTRKQIAVAMGLTVGQVRSRFYTLGMASKIRPWTNNEIDALSAAYGKATLNPEINLNELSKKLGREKTNVCRKARGLGLTSLSRKRVEKRKEYPPKYGHEGSNELRHHQSECAKKRIADNGHPRGMLGKKQTPEVITKMKAATRRAWADPNSKFNSEENRQRRSDLMIQRVANGKMRGGGYSRGAGGQREDLDGLYVRSSWEANYARYLNWLKKQKQIEKWEYEPYTFVFEKIKRGTRAYTPDFKITYANGRHEWHEVKGWMDPKSATRLRRMSKYFPEEKIIIIDKGWFRIARIQGIASLVPGWETQRSC